MSCIHFIFFAKCFQIVLYKIFSIFSTSGFFLKNYKLEKVFCLNNIRQIE